MSITKMRSSFSHFLRPLMLVLAAVFIFGAVMIIGMPAFQNKGGQGAADDTIAVVNGKKISRTQLDNAYKIRNQMMGSTAGNSPLQISDLMVSTLQQLLMENIKLTAAEKEGISAGFFEKRREKDRVINEQLDNVRKQVGDIISRGSKVKPSDREINMWLSRQNPPTSLDRLQADLNAKLTPDVVYNELLVRKLEDKIKAKANVGTLDDQKLTSFFEKAKVQHILIRSGGGLPDAQAEVRANKVLQEIKGGADFGAMAKQFSDDTTTKDKGGDLGWVYGFQDKDIQGLKKGQVSGVIKSPMYQAFRIVKVDDMKLELPKDFQARKSQIRDAIKQQMESQAINDYYTKAQKSAEIDIKDPEMEGYWLADQAKNSPDAAQRERLIASAVVSLKKASLHSQNQGGVHSKLAELYQMQGNTKQAISELNYVFDTARNEGADLRMMLAQLYIKTGDMKKAQEQLDIASDIGYADPSVHAQLITLFKQAGQPDRAAQEEKLLADYQKRMQARQPATMAPVKPVKKAVP